MQSAAKLPPETQIRLLPDPQGPLPRRVLIPLLICFACSGMSGLMYEVAWVRSLELVFGTTTFAVATVLASFMGGLACGSYVMGRFSVRLQRYHPLRVYALLEVLIPVAAIAVPIILMSLVPLYQAVWLKWNASFAIFSVLRFGLTALVLLVPTFLMGATLPVLSGFVSRSPLLGQERIGWLYTVNTIGAVLGCVAAGLVLFPLIGRSSTVWVAVSLNLAAAAGAYLLSRSPQASAPEHGSSAPGVDEPNAEPIRLNSSATGQSSRGMNAGLVAIYVVSGFVAMLYEVAWSRALVLVLGSSTYAYTIMLATFLCGLALGAAVATRLLRQSVHPLLNAGLCQVFIGLTTYFSVFVVGNLPYIYSKAQTWIDPSPGGLLMLQFLVAAGLMILPTLGLGAMFPITIRGLNASGPAAARTVGWAYALNTVGAIGGAVLGGFWLVPWLGAQWTLLTGILLNILLAVAALVLVNHRLRLSLRLSAATLLAAFGLTVGWSTPGWDPAVMSSGVFRYAKRYAGLSHAGFIEEAQRMAGQILAFDEGLTCTVTVSRTPVNTVLMVNGKPDASTPTTLKNPLDPDAPVDLFDLPTQLLLGQLPMLLAPQRDDVLVIGLGSGVTLGSVLTHPVRRVQCLELEAGVVRASRWFEDHNGRPLEDPRTQLVVNDARNHLLVTDQQYNVIISEPSNPWIPGAANLFTREFFELCEQRLTSGGVFCQWVQLYELQPDHFQTILRTFSSVFPNVHVFQIHHDAILVASEQPFELRLADLTARWDPAVKRDLERIGVHGWEDVFGCYWVGGDELLTAAGQGRLNTDDNMFIEFAAPLQVLAGQRKSMAPQIQTVIKHSTGAIPLVRLDPATDAASFWAAAGEAARKASLQEQARAYAAHSIQLRPNASAGLVLARLKWHSGDLEQARILFNELEERYPDSAEVLESIASFHALQSLWDPARNYAERALTLSPDREVAQFRLACALYHHRDFTGSLAILNKLPAPTRPGSDLETLPYYKGANYRGLERYEQAIPFYRMFLRRQPDSEQARLELADALYHSGQTQEASLIWAQVANKHAAQASDLIAESLNDLARQQPAEATRKLDLARTLDPTSLEATMLAARMRASKEEWQEAAALLETYLERYPNRPLAVGYLSQLWAQ